MDFTNNVKHFSEERIDFVIPKGIKPGEYKVEVKLANGNSDSAKLVVTRLPRPRIDRIAPDNISNQSVSFVYIYGSNFEEIEEIILISDDGIQFVLKNFQYSSTGILFSLPEGFEPGRFKVVLKNSEGVTSQENVYLKISGGVKENIKTRFEIDPETGDIRFVFETTSVYSDQVSQPDYSNQISQRRKVIIEFDIVVSENIVGSWNLSLKICNDVYYEDTDSDGYGNPNSIIYSCKKPRGYVENSEDCDDLNTVVNPKTRWYKDKDSDGYTDGITFVGCIGESGFVLNVIGVDCDDGRKDINPGAREICNGKDENCNSLIDEDVLLTFYRDSDSDGYGDRNFYVQACSKPDGYVSDDSDCNDSDLLINPNTIWYKDYDNDFFSDGLTVVQCTAPNGYKIRSGILSVSGDCEDNDPRINPSTVWYKDKDGDLYSDGTTIIQCQRPSGYSLLSELLSVSGDCDDLDYTKSPNTRWYKDIDNDMYSDGVSKNQCQRPSGYKSHLELVSISGDCDDSNYLVNPGTRWYKDQDSDGYYPAGGSQISCQDPYPENSTYFALHPGDCDDSIASVNPGASLNCNDVLDNDCSGYVERWAYTDMDGDRYAPNSLSICTDEVFPGMITVGSELGLNDCDDSVGSIYPGASLNCNDVLDNDCSGYVERWAYTDMDGDRYAPGGVSACVDVVIYPGMITVGSELGLNDCNDSVGSIYPGAPLNCDNGMDNDCSGVVDQWGYVDADGDRYAPSSVSSCMNVVFPGSITVGSELGVNDCDDSNASVNPNTIWYKDADHDNYYPTGGSQASCLNPFSEYATYVVIQSGDCNDDDGEINPGASEICNGVDDNCNGLTDEGLAMCGLPVCPTLITATSFFGSSTGDISLLIQWNDLSSNETNFVLQKSKSSTFSYSVTYVLPANTSSKIIQFQEPLTVFWFRVWAVNSTGQCSPATLTSVYTPPGLLWSFPLTGIARDWNNIYISPKSFDLDLNGKKEIIVSDNSGRIYAISTTHYNLEVSSFALWSVHYNDTRFATPAIAIFSGSPTIVIPRNPPGPGRDILILSGSGYEIKTINENNLIPYPPIVTDINGDARPDFIVATDNNRIKAYDFSGSLIFDMNLGQGVFSPSLFVFRGSTTTYVFGTHNNQILGYAATRLLFNYNIGSNVLHYVSTGDFNIDGIPEAVFVANDQKLRVVRLVKNPILKFNSGLNVRSKPAFGDFNSDGITDVVFVAQNRIFFVNGKDETLINQCLLNVNSFSSPVLIPGTNRVIVGRDFSVLDPELVSLNLNCSTNWSFNSLNSIRTTPLVFNVDGDGVLEVIVGSRGMISGSLIILDINGNSEAEITDTLLMGPVQSSPAVDDIDNNGVYEIIFGTDSGQIYVVSCLSNCSSSATIRFKATTSWGRIRTTPLIYDLNGDNIKDIVLAGDEERIFAISGTSVIHNQLYIIWSIALAGVGVSYDANGFPSSPTVVVKSGIPYIAVGSDTNNIYVIDGRNGSVVRSLNVGGKVFSSPATLDYNNDGVADLAFGSDNNSIYVLSGTDFSTFLFSYQTGGNIRSSPAIFDVDGDGFLDIGIGSDDNNIYVLNGISHFVCESPVLTNVSTTSPQISVYGNKALLYTPSNHYVVSLTNCSVIYSGNWGHSAPRNSLSVFYKDNTTYFVFSSGGRIVVSYEDFSPVYPFPFTHSSLTMSSPLIDDIDGDGTLEAVFIGSDASSSRVFAYRITNSFSSLHWKEFSHDRHNSSLYRYIPPSMLAPHLKFYDNRVIDTISQLVEQVSEPKYGEVGCSYTNSYLMLVLIIYAVVLLLIRRAK
ncbi:MAG: MopE-related protein [Candidatus Calescibacterium sp.]|nr:MopE-related protein [Candidatus Calescibacterium sp.]